jgi:hypothetical protein
MAIRIVIGTLIKGVPITVTASTYNGELENPFAGGVASDRIPILQLLYRRQRHGGHLGASLK